MDHEGWLKYVPTVGAGVAVVGFLVLGVQNVMLAGEVRQLSAEVTALHEFVAKEAARNPAAAATAARRMGGPPMMGRGPGQRGDAPGLGGPAGRMPSRPGGPPGGARRVRPPPPPAE